MPTQNPTLSPWIVELACICDTGQRAKRSSPSEDSKGHSAAGAFWKPWSLHKLWEPFSQTCVLRHCNHGTDFDPVCFILILEVCWRVWHSQIFIYLWPCCFFTWYLQQSQLCFSAGTGDNNVLYKKNSLRKIVWLSYPVGCFWLKLKGIHNFLPCFITVLGFPRGGNM